MKLENLTCEHKNYGLDIIKYLKHFEEVQNNMENPSWLGSMSEENLNFVLNGGGNIFLYYDNLNASVCSVMYTNVSDKTLEKFGLTSYDSKELCSCGPIMVNEKYVGNSLQKQMLLKLEEYGKSKDKKYIITTVDPLNIYSINNFLSSGYTLVNQVTLTRGIRNVYIKQI